MALDALHLKAEVREYVGKQQVSQQKVEGEFTCTLDGVYIRGGRHLDGSMLLAKRISVLRRYLVKTIRTARTL